MFEELSVIGDSIDEEGRVVHLASLPDSYDMLVTAFKASQNVSKWTLVTERLQYEETKIKEKKMVLLNRKLWCKNITSTKGDPSVLTVWKIDTLNVTVEKFQRES